MFRRLILENAHTWLAIAAFVLTASVFAIGVWRALRIRPEKRDHLANLPLDDGPHPTKIDTSSHRHG